MGVIGTGFIGASLIAHLIGLGSKVKISAYDIETANAEKTAHRHPGISVARTLKDLGECDIVFVCTPVSVIAAYVIELAGLLDPEAIIVDTGSTKTAIVDEVAAALPDFNRFVPGHPMSGSHKPGPDTASAETFTDKTFVLTPTPQTALEAVEGARALLEAAGSEVLIVPADLHDRILADTSHLAHLVAYAMVGQLEASAEDQNTRALIAGSFLRMTQYAASDPKMWADIFLANSANLGGAIDRLRTELDRLETAITNIDSQALMDLIRTASAKRRTLDNE